MSYKARVTDEGTLLHRGEVDEATLEATGSARVLGRYHRKLHAVQDLERAQSGVGHGDKLAVARDVAARHEVNWRTLLTWQSKFHAGGGDALIPQWGKTEGSSSIPEPLRKELLAMCAGRPQRSKAQIHREACSWCLANGYAAPSIYAVSRFLDKHLRHGRANGPRRGGKARGQAPRDSAEGHESHEGRVRPLHEKREPAVRERLIPTLYERLKDIIGSAKGLPPDLARNHDHYLHGQPKR